MTGDNQGLSARLNIEFFKRVGTGFMENKLWFEAGYCIDAPDILPAGSTCWDIYGFDMPTFANRDFSNKQTKR